MLSMSTITSMCWEMSKLVSQLVGGCLASSPPSISPTTEAGAMMIIKMPCSDGLSSY